MVIAGMKHQQDAAFVIQVGDKEMNKMSTKFTAAMRLLDAHKHSANLPHTSKQPIMQNDPKGISLSFFCICPFLTPNIILGHT